MRLRSSERPRVGKPRGRRRLRCDRGSILDNLAVIVDMCTLAIAQPSCMIPEPAPGLLKGGDFSDLLVRRALRSEPGRELPIYEHAAVVRIVAAFTRPVATITRRVASLDPIVAAMVWRIASSRIRGGPIVHGLGRLVLMRNSTWLAGPLAGRRDGQEGLAGGGLVIRSQ